MDNTRAPFGEAHTLDVDSLLHLLSSSAAGLSEEEARQRLARYGLNELPEAKGPSRLQLFLKQFKSWLIIMLLIAAAISWVAGEYIDTWVILAVVFVNAIIGFWQEYRAENAVAALRKIIVKNAKVIRDDQLSVIPAKNLVPGDIIVLEEGDYIPADARLVDARNFRTIEASLTGESLPVGKHTDALPAGAALADRKNCVWNSTYVAGGYARAIVVATGVHTAIGEISRSLEEIGPVQTNFLKKTDRMARQMAYIALASASMIFIAGYVIRGFEIHEILLTSIAALVAAIPSGMPAVISIVLAIGANRMAERHAIIREFTATESLGAVTAILSDKTGTLTQNSLTVRKVLLPGGEPIDVTGEGWQPFGNFVRDKQIIENNQWQLTKLLTIAAASNNAGFNHNTSNNRYELIGDPTEGALLVLARKGGIPIDAFKNSKVADLPFDADLKLRATVCKNTDAHELYVTGAPEKLLTLSTKIAGVDGEQTLTENHRSRLYTTIEEWSQKAMRVIALAYKPSAEQSTIREEDIRDLVFTGIVGMIDPLRPDAREAVEKCREAGIRVIMVTGDHVQTAFAIARSSGIIGTEDGGKVLALSGPQLEQLDKEEFDTAVRDVSVFARLTPAMKLRIATCLQSQGHLIAMTGDGVNDAPALQKADVGVSMGIMGTDVAREASDVVLSDDNFATIVNAVEEGRIIFRNVRQSSFFLITTNIAETVTLFSAIAMGLPLPMTATQLLWLNLVTDGVTGIALATEGKHEDVMKSAALPKNENILNRKILPFLLINVITMAVLSLTVFYHFLDAGLEKARTGILIVMACTQFFNIYNLRSLHLSVFKLGFFSNKYINAAVAVSAFLLLVITEVPALAAIFQIQALSWLELLTLLSISSLVLWAAEIYKLVKRRK